LDPLLVLSTATLMLVAYLAGSVPVGVLVARAAGGTDPRTVGSGRTGGTNALRALVFAGFRSGRGVGTGVGTMLVIQPLAVVLAAPVFVGVILLTRYVSLGSLLGSAAMLPVMLLFVVAAGTPLSYVLYAAVGAGFIWLAHSDNIDRLLHGKERKFDLGLLGGKRSGGS
jgi:glycerol-3-phosphate acyltransferase PlsY